MHLSVWAFLGRHLMRRFVTLCSHEELTLETSALLNFLQLLIHLDQLTLDLNAAIGLAQNGLR